MHKPHGSLAPTPHTTSQSAQLPGGCGHVGQWRQALLRELKHDSGVFYVGLDGFAYARRLSDIIGLEDNWLFRQGVKLQGLDFQNSSLKDRELLGP
ncbi:uncharacterized protein LACBIDRAFT_310602 [Laccaria bicolor S238N-H82]|uniref:Predicted protein n=1 Tax=Laccaria bicolor (strain S238N-H82 / ATCC MYA-4686) TaxID=486041 RepID=B0DUP1_LACBS|nr:uncharacterized protein LACBIDRAFT_310602 [Laccaria bicolor S238N-H82]EDR01575.1 predicted protein [Laccaria bicolor S238N-H82]|eukprot:XP_001887651.1 predicted protein [Laccaria bicolor S238N-H82]